MGRVTLNISCFVGCGSAKLGLTITLIWTRGGGVLDSHHFREAELMSYYLRAICLVRKQENPEPGPDLALPSRVLGVRPSQAFVFLSAHEGW